MGVQSALLDMARFPAEWSLSVRVEDGGSSFQVALSDGEVVKDTDVSGVWWRRTRQYGVSEALGNGDHRSFALAECHALIEGWSQTLGRRMINPIGPETIIDNKPYQLHVAAQLGMNPPRTMVTNSPGHARRFWCEGERKTIAKQVASRGDAPSPLTQLVEENAVQQLPLLRAAGPCLLQEAIPLGTDIRVTVIDDELFAAEIRIEAAGSQFDWRSDPRRRTLPHRLPGNVAASIRTFMRRTGLRYGAFDFRIDPDGVYRFLEVNVAGQYLWVEIETGQMISRAIASALSHVPEVD
ncbi:MAG: hypothetical protein QNJ44_02090 [Rhodobacter sp.]|nr:hypothetical protein [Rhodobacter sp.]